MWNLLKSFYLFQACCLHCGSLQARRSLLCPACERELLLLRKPSQAQLGFTVNCLYRWVPGQSDMLSRLVSYLKGGGTSCAWNFYAEKLAADSWKHLEGVKRICIIPAPGKGYDHAYEWAFALAQQLQAELIPCLIKKKTRNQRGKDFYQRSLIEMELVEKNTSMSKHFTDTLWIFADDILTTGSTARAAYLALGRPPHFQVWVLAERGLSCGASSNLL